MKIKILTPDENGLFSFTKEELEELLQESYDEGYVKGVGEHKTIYRGESPYDSHLYDVTCDSSEK